MILGVDGVVPCLPLTASALAAVQEELARHAAAALHLHMVIEIKASGKLHPGKSIGHDLKPNSVACNKS